MSDDLYGRVPHIWLLMGLFFLVLGLIADSGVRFYYVYPALGLICIARAFYVYRLRRKFNRRYLTTVLTETQIIERDRAKM